MFQMLRVMTAGESHGAGLTAILEGLPAGIPVSPEKIQNALNDRPKGFGRSGRMKFENDAVTFVGGLHEGKTTGAPIALTIPNVDQSFVAETAPVCVPRPGHADLAGGQKLNEKNLRIIAERSSARETACRVALGALARAFLDELRMKVVGRVCQIGPAVSKKEIPFEQWPSRTAESEFRCGDPEAETQMREAVKEAAKNGETLGGRFQVAALGVPPGLGHFISWEKRLDSRLAAALMSIPAIKAVEVGLGTRSAECVGSQMQDIIRYELKKSFWRETNRAGGIEGGVSNGETIWLTAAMKPLPTLKSPLDSVDVQTKQEAPAPVSRADVCAVPAACVVGEAMMALVLADACLEKFGGDSLLETRRNYENYCSALHQY